ncbi:MAG: hypothetical protein QOI43_1533 [Gaiellales bacterium]|nr:hypothetical protein [Gaiellales bacterium]
MITVVLDDDPTGTQAVRDVTVVLDWSDPAVWETVREGDRAVHVLTNSRAYGGVEAGRLVGSAATAARLQFPSARLLLRGDSTLRGHLWEEYEALRSVVAPGREDVPLLLVPALPAAGRVTIGGVHLLQRDGERIPLDRTEYARDGDLAYASSDLALWAEQRSGGRLSAADALRVPLEYLRRPSGAAELSRAIVAAAGLGRAAAVIPDAESEDDLRTIAAGLEQAEQAGIAVLVRAAPAFAAVLTGAAARSSVPPPGRGRGVLVLCGSFVPTTTTQIERLEHAYPGTVVRACVRALAGDSWSAHVDRLSEQARELISRSALAVVVTERERDPGLIDPGSQRQIAAALAEVARRVDAAVVVAKGGITSAVTARNGLGARSARVIGPILPGVVLWRLPDGTDYLVVPGNVGGPDLLVEVVAAILRSPRTIAEQRC